jgi:hypothetical protein
MYILVNTNSDDPLYVAVPEAAFGYTRLIERAQTYYNRASAESEKCGNEAAVEVSNLLIAAR